MADELKACRACGNDCRVERFEGHAIEGVMTIYMCANSTKFGGDCPDLHAYLNVNAWNHRIEPEAADRGVSEAWQPIETAPKHGKRIYGLTSEGKAMIIYANPELCHKSYVGWYPLPDHGPAAIQSLRSEQDRCDQCGKVGGGHHPACVIARCSEQEGGHD